MVKKGKHTAGTVHGKMLEWLKYSISSAPDVNTGVIQSSWLSLSVTAALPEFLVLNSAS